MRRVRRFGLASRPSQSPTCGLSNATSNRSDFRHRSRIVNVTVSPCTDPNARHGVWQGSVGDRPMPIKGISQQESMVGNLWRLMMLNRMVAGELAATVGEGGWATGEGCRYHWLMLAESHLTRFMFRSTVRRIQALPAPGGKGAAAKGKRTG
jgi:hypothetical protein